MRINKTILFHVFDAPLSKKKSIILTFVSQGGGGPGGARGGGEDIFLSE